MKRIFRLTPAFQQLSMKSATQPVTMALVVLSLMATQFEMAAAESAGPRLNADRAALSKNVSLPIRVSAGNAMAQATAQNVTRAVPAPASRPPQNSPTASHKGKGWKVVLTIAAAGAGAAILILTHAGNPPSSIEVLPPTVGPQ